MFLGHQVSRVNLSRSHPASEVLEQVATDGRWVCTTGERGGACPPMRRRKEAGSRVGHPTPAAKTSRSPWREAAHPPSLQAQDSSLQQIPEPSLTPQLALQAAEQRGIHFFPGLFPSAGTLVTRVPCHAPCHIHTHTHLTQGDTESQKGGSASGLMMPEHSVLGDGDTWVGSSPGEPGGGASLLQGNRGESPKPRSPWQGPWAVAVGALGRPGVSCGCSGVCKWPVFPQSFPSATP